MRKQILQNELQDAAAVSATSPSSLLLLPCQQLTLVLFQRQATRDRNKRLAEVVANTDELARRRDRLSAQIQELQAQLDAVTRARAAEEEKVSVVVVLYCLPLDANKWLLLWLCAASGVGGGTSRSRGE